MAITCAKCGEELLGSVNRCWKCGQQAVSTPDSGQAPPIRRSPVRMQSPNTVPADADESVAEVVTATTFDEENNEAKNDASEESQESTTNESEADCNLEANEPNPPNASEATTTSRPTSKLHQWRNWLAGTSLALGLLAVSIGWLTPWVLIAALVGVACGILSITSQRKKGLAVFALLVCLLGVSVSSVRLAYDAYFFVRGEAVAPDDPLLEDDYLDPLEGLEPME